MQKIIQKMKRVISVQEASEYTEKTKKRSINCIFKKQIYNVKINEEHGAFDLE